VSTFLGLLGVAVYVVSIIALAAAVTWLVVRLSPPSTKKSSPDST
jgi:hypothetical protein